MTPAAANNPESTGRGESSKASKMNMMSESKSDVAELCIAISVSRNLASRRHALRPDDAMPPGFLKTRVPRVLPSDCP